MSERFLPLLKNAVVLQLIRCKRSIPQFSEDDIAAYPLQKYELLFKNKIPIYLAAGICQLESYTDKFK